jgi:epidermal growth factor receptor substrate 15
MESNKVSTLLEEANKEAYEKNIKILACLNELKAIIEKSTAQPFEINKDDKYESEINIRNSVSYLEESSLEINNFESINLKLFKLLFIPNGHLKYVDLDEKIKDYQLALKLLKNELKAEEKIDYIDKVIKIKKIIGWKKLLKSTFVTISDLELIIAIVLKFSKSIVEISDFLMFILKKKHFYNFEIKFDLNNLIDVPEANIAESFNNLLKNDTEYFYLDFENGNIVKKSLSAEETSKAINQTENENQDSKKKNKKKKNKKNKKKIEHSQELISESIKGEDAKTTTVSQKEEKPDEKESSKKDESEKNETKNIEITEEEENQSEKNIINSEEISVESRIISIKDEEKNDLKEIVNNLINEVKEQKKELQEQKNKQEIQNKEITDLKSTNIQIKEKAKRQEKEITDLKNTNIQINKKAKTQEKEITDLKNTNIQLKENYKNLNNKLVTIKNKLDRVELELNLIKSRGAIKTLIDFFYKGFNLKGEVLYEDKFAKIAEKLNQFNDIEKYDIVTINKIRIILKESVAKYLKSNENAHILDKSKPILAQLFSLIEPNDNYEEVINKLVSIRADA